MVYGLTRTLTVGETPDFESALAWALTMEEGSARQIQALESIRTGLDDHEPKP